MSIYLGNYTMPSEVLGTWLYGARISKHAGGHTYSPRHDARVKCRREIADQSRRRNRWN